MSLVVRVQNLKLAMERLEYADQAIDNAHLGAECPKDIDEYCEKCLPKIVAVGERYGETPRSFRVLVRILHPIKIYYALAEFEFCQGVWSAYQLGLSRGRGDAT